MNFSETLLWVVDNLFKIHPAIILAMLYVVFVVVILKIFRYNRQED
jgi:hypothetical protein